MTTRVAEINKSNKVLAEQLVRLAQLYQEGQASPLLTQTLDKLFAYEIDEARTQLQQLRADLVEFEAQYLMPTDLFYQHYQAGETDDRMDFIEWASLIQMSRNLEKRLQLLTGEN